MHSIFDERITGFVRGIDKKADLKDIQKIKDKLTNLEKAIDKMPEYIEIINTKISETEDKIKNIQNNQTEKTVEIIKHSAVNNCHEDLVQISPKNTDSNLDI